MSIALLDKQNIDAWHEMISTHAGFQILPEELLLPTRSSNATTLPSLLAPNAEQPKDTQSAIAQAAIAVAMAQAHQPSACHPMPPPLPPSMQPVATGRGQPPAAAGAQQQPMMVLSNGMVLPMAGSQPTSAGATPLPTPGAAMGHHPGLFCSPACDAVTGIQPAPVPAHTSQRSSSKNCVYPGCTKGAIGKLKLCIAHGGGKRCTVPGCNKAAQGQQPLCKAHGGGRRCQFPGCPRSARDRTDLCIGHGGGKRCAFVGCSTSARSGTLYCSLHDGVIKKHSARMGVASEVGVNQEGQRVEPQLARNGNGVYGYMPGTVPQLPPRGPTSMAPPQ